MRIEIKAKISFLPLPPSTLIMDIRILESESEGEIESFLRDYFKNGIGRV